MSEDIERGGISRRNVMRGAVVGGSLLWATPVVQSLGGVAHATHGSPHPEGECVWYAIHLDANGGCNDIVGSSAPGSTDCADNGSHWADVVPGGCAFFDSIVRTGDTWTVYLKPVVEATTVQGYSKCASESCEPAVGTDGTTTDTVVFFECPKPTDPNKTQDISNVQLVFCVPSTD